MNNTQILNHIYKYQALPKGETINSKSFMVSCIQNRMLYFVSSLSDLFPNPLKNHLKQINKKGVFFENAYDSTSNTIQEISLENSLEYIVVKDKRQLPYINADLDLLVHSKDYNLWHKQLLLKGFNSKGHKVFLVEQDNQDNLIKDDGYKVDITTRFDWQESSYFDMELLWESYNHSDKKLSNEFEFLINIAGVIFKRMSVSLLDYYYLNYLLSLDLDFDLITKQAKKYSWDQSLDKTIKFINAISPEQNSFPVLFPLNLSFHIAKEKLANKKFSANYWSYMFLARTRYYLFNKKHVPFHVYWYSYEDLISLNKDIKL